MFGRRAQQSGGRRRGEHRDDVHTDTQRHRRDARHRQLRGRRGPCFFNTQVNLLTPDGPPVGLPGDTWARQTVTVRSTDRDVYQNAWYSAPPAGMPRELKGANHDNVLSKAYKSITDYQISVTYFGGGPMERFAVDGDSVQTDWRTGQPNLKAGFIVCSDIQVVFGGGVNVTTPSACAQTTFS